jgi:hypothetical protein
VALLSEVFGATTEETADRSTLAPVVRFPFAPLFKTVEFASAVEVVHTPVPLLRAYSSLLAYSSRREDLMVFGA